MKVFFPIWLRTITFITTALLWELQPALAAQKQLAAADCFPFESLSPPLRARAEGLLLKALDSEALYTIAADIKPMSSGIFSIEVPINARNTREVEDLDQIMRTWACGGEVTGGLYRFKAVYNGKRSMDVFVFNHPQFIKILTTHSHVFAPLGISSSSKPADILNAVDSANRQLRHRGLGLLFGIPVEAIDFFVAADARQQVTGNSVKRDFVMLPTFLTFQGEGLFAYAVPKGQSRTDADRVLASRVQSVFDEYLKRRSRYIHGNSSAGVLPLVRDWFNNGKGDVRPSNAYRQYIKAASLQGPKTP
jgi:hypothetical protein